MPDLQDVRGGPPEPQEGPRGEAGGYEASCREVDDILGGRYLSAEGVCADAKAQLADQCCYWQCLLCEVGTTGTDWYKAVAYGGLATTTTTQQCRRHPERGVEGRMEWTKAGVFKLLVPLYMARKSAMPCPAACSDGGGALAKDGRRQRQSEHAREEGGPREEVVVRGGGEQLGEHCVLAHEAG